MSTSTATLPKSAAHPVDIRAIYEHYVAVYATRDVEEIKKNHSVDSRFWLHNGGKPVVGVLREVINQLSVVGRPLDVIWPG